MAQGSEKCFLYMSLLVQFGIFLQHTQYKKNCWITLGISKLSRKEALCFFKRSLVCTCNTKWRNKFEKLKEVEYEPQDGPQDSKNKSEMQSFTT